jgi:hypothetical protein
MFYNTIREFSEIVADYTVSEFRRYGAAMSFVAKVVFIDGSVLFIKDYLFIDGKRKYSYHWQDDSGSLLSRWDNAPHHDDIISFPHHRHLHNAQVTASTERTLPDIFHFIRSTLIRDCSFSAISVYKSDV